MKIVVCVKQVAVLGDEVEFTDDARDVDPDYLDFALNEWDSYATEEALRTHGRRWLDGCLESIARQTESVREVIAVDNALPGGYYKRAWELVNATDKEYLKYVAELSK